MKKQKVDNNFLGDTLITTFKFVGDNRFLTIASVSKKWKTTYQLCFLYRKFTSVKFLMLNIKLFLWSKYPINSISLSIAAFHGNLVFFYNIFIQNLCSIKRIFL